MKEIFLSFRPEYFKPILYGLKLYEYRRRFCNEETRAYLYLSGKKRMVIGVMDLGKPIRLDKIVDDLKEYPDTYRRVTTYVNNGVVCAVPIKSFSLFLSPILLADIKKEIYGFRPPRMYYVLDNHIALKRLLNKIELKEQEVTHKHDRIYYDNLALSVDEIMKTEKYKKIDSVIDKMSDYKDIL